MSGVYDAVVIGGGAAGLYCAMHAGRRGRRVLVLEHNRALGSKILISGGGRCNFTNLGGDKPERYLSANPHFARSALARHRPAEIIALIEKHGVRWYEKTLGQLFCEGAGASKRIVQMLADECAAAGVDVRTGVAVRGVTKAERFRVETSVGDIETNAVVVATGGLSIPKLGANDIAFRIAAQFGVPVIAPRPGLVPLTFNEADLACMRALSGVSHEVIACAGGASFREAALFTHRGLSGPAILQVSSYWRVGDVIAIDWAPDQSEDFLAQRKRERPKALTKTVLAEIMPARLADALAPAGAALGDAKDQALVETMHALKAFALTPAGTEGFAKAEVTVGGVDTDALVQQSMQARAVPGLFFVGECVDVTGWLGGYNFQWAWASGWCAGTAI